MDEATLRTRTRELLRRLGPLTARELAARLSGASDGAAVPPPRELRQLLLDEPDPDLDPDDPAAFHPFPLYDGRLVDLDHLLDGTVFTHVVTEGERTRGEVETIPDLGPLVLCSDDARRLPVHGHDAPARYLSGGRLAGPPGWLPDTPVLVARLRDGAVELSGSDAAPEVDGDVADRLARGWGVIAGAGVPPDEVELVIETLARHPRLFDTPRAPLGELLAAAGIAVEDDHLVPLGEDGVPLPHPGPVDADAALRSHLAEDHGLDNEQVAAVFDLLDDLETVGDHLADVLTSEDPSSLDVEGVVDLDAVTDDLAILLASMDGATALIEDVVGAEFGPAALLLGLFDRCRGGLRGTHVRANGHYLRARLLELVADDHAEAERELRHAIELDEHPEATFELVRFLADRGQAAAALGLLRRVEGPGVAAWTEALEPWAAPGPVTAGRNDPCPCGSGRKHKVCCARHNGWPLQARVPWVWDKLVRFSLLPVAREVIEDVASAAGLPPDISAMDDVAVANLALFDGGLVEEMCDLRGALLPADELAMLRAWADVRAGLYEAVEVDPGRTLTLLDLSSGERVELRERSLSRSLTVGDAGLTWIVPEPDGPAPVGGIVRVAEHQRRQLLDLLDEDPSAEELAAWYASLSAPPALTNTDGDPLVFTTLRWEVDDPEAVGEALRDRLGGPDEEADADGLAFTVVSGEQRCVRGSLTLAGTSLTGFANSATRAAALVELVEALAPGARLVDEERLPATDLPVGDGAWDAAEAWEDDGAWGDGGGRGDGGGTGGAGGAIDLAALDPGDCAALEAQLDEMMAAHEDAWVDTPLPALDGATPREAADDPTRRPALERLLAEFREHAGRWESPGRPMDADRLARLLGL